MKPNGKTRAFLAFSRDLLGYKKMTTAADVLCNVLIFSQQAAVAYCVREILNGLEGEPGAALRKAAPYLAGILIVSLLRIAAILCCAALDARRSYYYQNRLRMNILNKLLHKENVLSVSGRSGALFEVLDDDVPTSTFPAELLTEVLGYFIYTVIAFAMLLAVNWRLTLFIFIPLSVAIYVVQRLSERLKERRQQNREAHDAASTFISDIACASLAVQAMGATAAVLGRYDAVNKRRRAAVVKDAVLSERVLALVNGAVCVGSAVMMLIAARLMGENTFGLGDFSLFIAHLGTLADCTLRIVDLVYEARKAEVSYERILDATDAAGRGALSAGADIELRRDSEPDAPAAPAGKLSSFEVRDLSFTYSGEDGFRGVSFSVRPGTLVAVAGRMASGKSTLLSVLMGLMPPDGGELLWNGEPLHSLAGRAPNCIAGAPQQGGFFAADVQTNLCLGMEADACDIARALRISALDGVASSQEDWLMKNIGDHGDKLSGGQRQRLALARTIVRAAEICIYDDCVSALDEQTRRDVLHRLTGYLSETGRSAIIATNSRPFLEAADTVILMSGGRVEAMGSFAELMRSCAAFPPVVSPT